MTWKWLGNELWLELAEERVLEETAPARRMTEGTSWGKIYVQSHGVLQQQNSVSFFLCFPWNSFLISAKSGHRCSHYSTFCWLVHTCSKAVFRPIVWQTCGQLNKKNQLPQSEGVCMFNCPHIRLSACLTVCWSLEQRVWSHICSFTSWAYRGLQVSTISRPLNVCNVYAIIC